MSRPPSPLTRAARVLPTLVTLLLLAPLAAHAQATEKSVVVQFTPGSQTGHGFELARVRVNYRFSTHDGHIVVYFRLDQDSLDTNGVYYFQGKHYAVRDPNPQDYNHLKVQGTAVRGGSVGTFSGSAPASGGFGQSLMNKLDRLDAHLPPRPSGERYPKAYVDQFLEGLSVWIDMRPPLTNWAADEQVKRQLREAEQAERLAQKAKEREERLAQEAKEKADREAQAAREKAARDAQRQQEQAQRLAQQQAQREQQQQQQQRASDGAGASTGAAAGSVASSSSAPLTREQRQAEADAKYQAYVNNFQAEQQRKAAARAEAQKREQEEREAEQQRAREAFAAQQEQQRLDAAEREAQAQQIAESAAPLMAAGIEALDEVFSGMDSGLPDFREVALGCQLSSSFTPGCSAQLRVGAFFYLVAGGGYNAAPNIQSSIYSRRGFQSGERVGVAEASVSSWFAELGGGFNFPIDDQWRVMVDIAPFLGAGSVKPSIGFSEESYSLTLFGFSGSASGWYKIPDTEYQVGLRFRLQGVGLGFGAEDEDKDLLASEDYYQSGGTMTRELRKNFDEGGMYPSLGVQFAVPF